MSNKSEIELRFDNAEDGDHLIVVNKEGFFYNGERVDDVEDVYSRLSKFLEAAGHPKPGEGETVISTKDGHEIVK